MKTVLITGEHGYIASAVREYLARWPENYAVRTLGVRGEEWKAESFAGVDVILHAAALVHRPESKDDPGQTEEYRRVNTLLPYALACKAKAEGVGQFLFLSSQSVYGLTAAVGRTVEITRDTPLSPADNYGRSKLEAEQLLLPLGGPTFHVAVLRPPMIYGRGCKGNYVALSKLAQKAPAFPRVENRRSMLYIGNLTEFIRDLIDDEAAGIFCPQNREYTDVSRMAAEIARLHGKKLPLIPGFGWALGLASLATPAVNKAFGSLVYARELSAYPKDYQIVPLGQSIAETEGQ